MSRPLNILIGSIAVASHVNPAVPIARTLVKRGHTVRRYTGRA